MLLWCWKEKIDRIVNDESAQLSFLDLKILLLPSRFQLPEHGIGSVVLKYADHCDPRALFTVDEQLHLTNTTILYQNDQNDRGQYLMAAHNHIFCLTNDPVRQRCLAPQT